MSGEKDFFEVLGINYGATPADVQSAFDVIYQKLQDSKETSHAAKHLHELHNAYLVFRTESAKKTCSPTVTIQSDFSAMSWTTRPAYRQVCPGCGSPFCSSAFRKEEDDEEEGYSDEEDEPDEDDEEYISEGEGGLPEHHQSTFRTRQRLREKLEDERQQRRLREQLQLGSNSEKREDTRSVDDLIAFIEGGKKAGKKKEKKKVQPKKPAGLSPTAPAAPTAPSSVPAASAAKTEKPASQAGPAVEPESVSAKLEQVLMQSLKMAFPAMTDREASHILSEHKTDITSSITALLDKIPQQPKKSAAEAVPQGKRRAPGSAPVTASAAAGVSAASASASSATAAAPAASMTAAAAAAAAAAPAPAPASKAAAASATPAKQPAAVSATATTTQSVSASAPVAAAAAPAPLAAAAAPASTTASTAKKGKQPAPAPVIEPARSGKDVKGGKTVTAGGVKSEPPSSTPVDAAAAGAASKKGKAVAAVAQPEASAIAPKSAEPAPAAPAAAPASAPIITAPAPAAAASAKALPPSKQKRAERRGATATKSSAPPADEVRLMVQQLIELIPDNLDEATAALALAAHDYSLPATAEALLDSMSGWQQQGKGRAYDESDSESSDDSDSRGKAEVGKKRPDTVAAGTAAGSGPTTAVRGQKERGIGFVKSMRSGQFGFIVLKDEERAERIGDVFFYVGSNIPSSVNVGSKVEFDMMLSKRYKGKWEAFNIVPHTRAPPVSVPKPAPAPAAKSASATTASTAAAAAASTASEHSSPAHTPVSPLQATQPAEGAAERSWAIAAGSDDHTISGSGVFAPQAPVTPPTAAAAAPPQSVATVSPVAVAAPIVSTSAPVAAAAPLLPPGVPIGAMQQQQQQQQQQLPPQPQQQPQMPPLGALTGDALVRARQQLGLVIQVAAGIMRPEEIERIFVESGYNVDRTVATILEYGRSLLSHQRGPQQQPQQPQQQQYGSVAAPISPPGMHSAVSHAPQGLPVGVAHSFAQQPLPQGLGLSQVSSQGLNASAPPFAPSGAHAAHPMLQTPPGIESSMFGPPAIMSQQQQQQQQQQPQRTPQSVTAAADLAFGAPPAGLGSIGGYAAPGAGATGAGGFSGMGSGFGSAAGSMFAPPQAAPAAAAGSGSGAFYSPLFGGPSPFSPLTMPGVSASQQQQQQQQQLAADDDGMSALLGSVLTDALDDPTGITPSMGVSRLLSQTQRLSQPQPPQQQQQQPLYSQVPGAQPIGAIGSGLYGPIGSGLRQATPQFAQMPPTQPQQQTQPTQQQWSLY